MKLKNETAIVTGSTRGIGKQIAELLLKEGCKVTICSRSEEKVKYALAELQGKYGDSVIGYMCDVSKPEDVMMVVGQTINTFGSVRILVASAGLNTLYGPFDCMNPKMVKENAETILNTNLIGVMNSISAVMPYMNEQKYGRIITLSGGGVDRPIDNMAIYSASKGAVYTFSKCIALELDQKEADIRINIFQPGMIKTDLLSSVTCVPDWKTNEEIEENLEFALVYLGGDIEKSCKKVLPYVSPKCKSQGKLFRGYSLPKLIFNAIKMRRAMKKKQ